MPIDPIEIVGGLAIGEGLGGAIADTVVPRLQGFKNDQWSKHTDVPLDAAEAAAVAAENYDTYANMETEGSFSGYDAARFRHLYDLTVTAPGLGELLTLLRRSDEFPIPFDHGLRKAKLETQWDKAVRNLRWLRIPGPDLAYMVVRGVVADGGTLPGALPTHSDHLALPPQLPIDTLAEAKKTGWDAERFAALVARSGLAMAPGLAAQAYFRGILTDNDYLLTIARGDLFPAYAAPMREVSRQILTAGEYAELQLRGYYDRATRLANTAKHGMSEHDSDLLYDVQGRGLSLHAAFIAERRGGVFKGDTSAIPEWALYQLERGNLRPEVYNLAWAGRHTYPSAFVTRALLQAGAITEAQGETIFLDTGWPDWLATKVAKHYAPSGAAVADPHVTKADNGLWTTQRTAYVKDRSDDAFATETLTQIGVAASAIPTVLARWQREREIQRAGLSAAQIKKAYYEATFTKDEATARLVELGWSTADAIVYLGE